MRGLVEEGFVFLFSGIFLALGFLAAEADDLELAGSAQLSSSAPDIASGLSLRHTCGCG